MSRRPNYNRNQQRNQPRYQQNRDPQRDLFKYRLPNSLKRCINNEIFVSVKIRRHYIRGILVEYDMHLNLVMKDAKEVIYKRGKERIIERGDLMVRGDSIIYIDFDGKREYLLHKAKSENEENKIDIQETNSENAEKIENIADNLAVNKENTPGIIKNITESKENIPESKETITETKEITPENKEIISEKKEENNPQ